MDNFNIYIYIHTHIYVHIYIYIYICMYICICMGVCIRALLDQMLKAGVGGFDGGSLRWTDFRGRAKT